VLAPGFYASQDMRTPVRIAIAVLVLTQLMNIALVPWLRQAGLALSISLGAMINAGWLLVGLIKRGSYKPSPGWGRFLLQVTAATALVTVFLMWGSASFDWTAMRAHSLQRAGLMAAMLAASAAIYFAALWASGMKLRQFLAH